MNISFIDYGKRAENFDKKIKKYDQKIIDLLNSYEDGPACYDDLDFNDRKLYDRYNEAIIKFTKKRDESQEKARVMAENGKIPLTTTQKVVSGILALSLLGGTYLYLNRYNPVQNDGKNNIPKEDTNSLDQSNNSKEPNVGGQEGPTVDNDGLTPVEPGVAGPQGEAGPVTEDQSPTANTNDDSLIYNDGVEDEPQLPSEQLPVEDKDQNQKESLFDSVLTDIDNDEQVYARAKEIVELYDEFAPQYMVDVEYAADMLRYINGGVVNEVSREAALDVIKTFEVLMNNEYLYAKEIRNKGVTGREESVKTIDYAIFFKDNTRAQKLATKVTSYRSPIIKEPLGDTKEYEQGFTTLLMNSWYNQGYQEISTYALETSGMSAVIDKLFLNTADVIRADQSDTFDITVHEPIDDKDITLSKMIDKVNEANCLAEMTADNGETFEMYVNKFTYDMEGMLKEAVYNKQAYDENFGRKLK